MQNNTLYLIDGSSYIYRAYYAIRHLSSPRGFPPMPSTALPRCS